MPINPAIAMSFQAPKFEDPMNNLIKMEQIKAYQQNALAKQLEAEVAQESLGQQRGLRNYLAGLEPGASPDPTRIALFGKSGRELAQTLTTAAKNRFDMQSKLYKDMYLPILAQAKTRDDVNGWYASMQNDPRLKGFLTEEGRSMLPKTDEEVRNYVETALVPFSDIYKRQTQQKSIDAANARNQASIQATAVQNILKNNARYDEVAGAWVANPGFPQSMIDQAQAIVNQTMSPDLGEPIEGTQPSAPPLPPPVPVEGMPGARTLEMRPTDQAVPTKLPTVPGQEATPTLLTSPEDIQAARAAGKAKIRQEEKNVDLVLEEPDMRNASASNMSLAFNTIGQINTLLNDPALKSVTGNWAGAVPTLTGLMNQGNANANALIQSLRSKAWLNSVKAFGKSSGLSPITDVEGAKLEAAYAMLDQTQGTPQFKKALEDFQKQLESSNRSIVNGFNRKYGNLGIKGWQPMSIVGGFPDEAIQTLKSDPTPQNIKEFNQHFGEDTAKYFLQGVK